MKSSPIIRIFEGVDRLGKSTSINWLRKEYEEQGKRVVVLHEKDVDNRVQLTTNEEFNDLRESIEAFHEKSIFSLDAYAYLIQIMFENGIDVVLIDRLYLTSKAYADCNRPGSITTAFGSSNKHWLFVHTFCQQLKRITDDVELYCFVRPLTDTEYEDDDLDERWKNSANSLLLVNKCFHELFHEHQSLPSTLFVCSKVPGETWYDALPQLQEYLANKQ